VSARVAWSPARFVAANIAVLTCAVVSANAEGERFSPTKPPNLAAGVHLRLEGASCKALRLDDVMPFAVAETGGKLVKASADDADAIVVRCADDRVIISCMAPDGAPRSYRADLAGTAPSVRPRVVAIAIGEVLHDLELVERSPAAPAVTLRPRVTSRETAAPPARPAPLGRALQAGAFAQAMRFQRDSFWILGGGVRFDYASTWWNVGLDAAVAAHEERVDTGTVRVFLADASPYFALRFVSGTTTMRIGGGYALGLGQIAGSAPAVSTVAATTVGPWGGPFAVAAFGYAVTDWLTIAARGQTGWATMSVVGQVCLRSTGPNQCDSLGPELELKGLWARLQIGAELTL
jgi:hypothetical protein